MLSRIFSLHSRNHLRLLSRTISSPFTASPSPHPFTQSPKSHFLNRHHFSTNNNNNNNGEKPTSGFWKLGQDDDNLDDIFGTHDRGVGKVPAVEEVDSKVDGSAGGRSSWVLGDGDSGEGDVGLFEGFEKNASDGEGGKLSEAGGRKPWAMGESEGGVDDGGLFGDFGKSVGGEDNWLNAGGEGGQVESRASSEFRPWNLGGIEEGKVEDVFGIWMGGESGGNVGDEKTKEEREMISAAEKLQLEKEELALLDVIKGPDRAFGDLIAASGITDAMLDSLIALKNFQDIQGLPPLSQIEDERYNKTTRKSSRYEMELQKQEEAAKARVRKVDEKGRAYGTGKRKCSIARVWIQPGEGKFWVNDKEFDAYFPVLDHRAALLRPFSETKTLGLWDVKCTVKGGGVSGQVDAVQLGISRALQNWEPGLRPPLKQGGFLTRDPRVVERKKPGKAKARKSFQWVKR